MSEPDVDVFILGLNTKQADKSNLVLTFWQELSVVDSMSVDTRVRCCLFPAWQL